MYERLQKINVTVAHRTVIRLLTALGENHDAKVVQWCSALRDQLAAPMMVNLDVHYLIAYNFFKV